LLPDSVRLPEPTTLRPPGPLMLPLSVVALLTPMELVVARVTLPVNVRLLAAVLLPPKLLPPNVTPPLRTSGLARVWPGAAATRSVAPNSVTLRVRKAVLLPTMTVGADAGMTAETTPPVAVVIVAAPARNVPPE